ncbi:hypothetical protein ACN9VK_08635 [Staphylococcus caprae]|uniref:hypothetical protein n=1 Tax=Staphylococcus caprae TaxID=29380 RepID=UPI003B2118AA
MDELVKMTFSDGNGNVLREGYVAVTNEFLEQINVENHSITSPEYVKELKRKARAFDEILNIHKTCKYNSLICIKTHEVIKNIKTLWR